MSHSAAFDLQSTPLRFTKRVDVRGYQSWYSNAAASIAKTVGRDLFVRDDSEYNLGDNKTAVISYGHFLWRHMAEVILFYAQLRMSATSPMNQ